MSPSSGPRLAIVLKGYPRLSETFIAQEIAALEHRGLHPLLVSLRHPTDRHRHPVHERIRAAVAYLPEYLYQEPLRVLRGWLAARRLPGYAAARKQWLRDLVRDFTPNRGRRFGQACVMAAELPSSMEWLHCHFLHTPGSVTRYAAMMRGLPWSVSAHAKDIWTTPDWELAEKLADCSFAVTCTGTGLQRLQALAPDPARLELLYHGLDFAHLPAGPARDPADARNGSDPADPVRILSVGRAVAKKGYDDLISALALLPAGLEWNFVHVGGGPLREALIRHGRDAGIADRLTFIGARPQPEVFARYAEADLFVLASRVAEDGDRDGLPNVLMEAQSQGLPCVATNVAAIPELIVDGETGLLCPPRDVRALAGAIERLIRDPGLRRTLAEAGERRVRATFSFEAGIDRLMERLGWLREDAGER